MTGREIIQAIIDTNGLDTEYIFNVPNRRSLGFVPKTLSEITTVTVEGKDVVLRTDYPLEASRYFGLSDKYTMYAFDGNTMRMYSDPNDSCDWSFSYGANGHAIVTGSVATFEHAVKSEMRRQVMEKNLLLPENVNPIYLFNRM